MTDIRLRPATPHDLAVVLPMNNAAVPAVSRLDAAALASLADQSRWFTVAERRGELVAFLIGLHGPGLAYESLNYRAFCRQYPEGFLYVDRVVVNADHRNAGLGALLYEAFAEFGRADGAPVLTAEVNVRPRNDGSLRFHRRFGFRPVGEQDTDDGAKRVQFLAYDLTDEQRPLDRDRMVDLAAVRDAELAARLEFVFDLDRLKTVQRKAVLIDGTRRENTAEHSWHVAMMAIALAPYAAEPVDLNRVVKILLVHDIVEADAGDTYFFDTEAAEQKLALENEAADRIFGLLPGAQGIELRELWDEYETRSSAEGRFAYACDRAQPFLLNAANSGRPWHENGISADRIAEVVEAIRPGAPMVAEMVDGILTEAVAHGHLPATGDDRDG
jgi:putative hydrolase of HD superfamily